MTPAQYEKLKNIARTAEPPEVFRPRIEAARAKMAALRSNDPAALREQAQGLKEQAGAVDTDSIDVEVVPFSSETKKLPQKALKKIGALAAWIRENVPVPEGEAPPSEDELLDRAWRTIQALKACGVKLAKQRKPILLLSAHAGGNPTARMLTAMLCHHPGLRRTQLDRRVGAARDCLQFYEGRVL
jgi:hypothetical protein